MNLNLDLVAARQRAQAPKEPSADPGLTEEARRAEMGRSLRLWLDLQDAVCGLLDSTTTQNRNASAGVSSPTCWQPDANCRLWVSKLGMHGNALFALVHE